MEGKDPSGAVNRLLNGVANRSRHTHRWILGSLTSRLRRAAEPPPTDVWVAITDHFEPLWKQPDQQTALERVARWRRSWPGIAARHHDTRGRRPVYSFFYPQEEYQEALLEPLAEMTREGIADVDIHIHHDCEGETLFVEKMRGFIHALHGNHGLLRRHEERIVFGFIHGNWALDNSRPDGRWCGLNNEISILRDLGCYADFTLPSAGEPTQAGPVNAIYRVTDDPARPRSHARGVRVRKGLGPVGDLTLITGPLGFDFRSRGFSRPRIESGELAGTALPSRTRVKLWLRLAPRIEGHVFVKLFGHGAQERNSGPLLDGGLDRLFSDLSAECAHRGLRLHYVSAWDMFRAVEALRLGSNPLTGP
jgi:hypothetical protein